VSTSQPPASAPASLWTSDHLVSDRPLAALLLLRRGYALEDIERLLPNLNRGWRRGVTSGTARAIVQRGLRSLASQVVRGRPGPGLPRELWPPEEVRARIVAAAWGRRGPAATRELRQWIESPAVPEAPLCRESQAA